MTNIPKPDPKAPRCPHCTEPSFVFPGGVTSTLLNPVEFFDREGRRHVHDGNTTAMRYSCERGHSWTVEFRATCWCGSDKLP